MNDLEDLLRETFAARQHDLGGAAPSLAAAREQARRTRRQRAAVGLGAVAAVAVLAGSTLAVRDRAAVGPAPGIPAASEPGPASGGPGGSSSGSPAGPSDGRGPGAYAAAPIVSAGGRTSATLTWGPTWLPAGAGERRREVAPGQQTRDYGGIAAKSSVEVVIGTAGCDQTGTPVDVGGRPGRLRTSVTYPRGPEVCVPLTGGSLRVTVGGTAAEAVRVAASVRAGRRDAVVVPVSVRVPVTTVSVGADLSDQSPWNAQIDTGDTDVEIGGPDPTGLDPNTTVGGRPAHISTSAAKGTFLTVPLSSRLWASLAGDRDRTIAIASGLQLSPIPDYSWLTR
jgi:hypothetical protein